MSHETAAIPPWYKQPWLWFILTPILAAMLVGFTMLSIAIKQQNIDPPLDREYIRDGRGYVVDDTLSAKAKELGITGDLRIDTDTGEAILNMQGGLSNELQEIELHIKVGANHRLDHVITLRRIETLNQFNGSLTKPITARSTFIIMSPDESWKVLKDAQPPFNGKVIAFRP